MREKVMSSEIKYRGKILNLRIDEIETKNGKKSKREIIEHKDAVAILAINEEEEIILVRQYRIAVDDAILELPAGLIEDGESEEAAARRELREETGYTANRMEKMHTFYSSAGFSNEKIHIFFASDLKSGEMDLDEGENIVVEKFHIDQINRLIEENEDSKTVIALLLYKDKYIGNDKNGEK
ncbi:MAG: NUDIX hydrolase [Andreesenia angusta]|nr:NUDIX hydrolase [Andreesenia angusta]